MLEVVPGRRTLPMPDSVVVSTAKTVLVLLSKVARTLRFGFNAISPGDVPALIGETGAIVSFVPLMNTSLP
jgi:hypothetical protein